jgi:DNA-binding Lrp family transcriptional regulator
MSLSPRGQAILRQIATPISAGYSPREVASALGTSPNWVSRRLDELRDELERLN